MLIAAAAALLLGGGVFAVVQLTGNDGPQQPPQQARVVQPGAPGQTGRTLSPQELASMPAAPHRGADTLFFQQMIPHHGQALEMAALVNDRTASTDLPLLAQRITVSQQEEIERMRRWLTQRGEALPEQSGHAEHTMPGMLTDQELAQLAAARDSAFDKAFLELMIRHHEGALFMVQQLYAGGGGLDPESDRFAREIEADQTIEIQRMRDMLAEL